MICPFFPGWPGGNIISSGEPGLTMSPLAPRLQMGRRGGCGSAVLGLRQGPQQPAERGRSPPDCVLTLTAAGPGEEKIFPLGPREQFRV